MQIKIFNDAHVLAASAADHAAAIIRRAIQDKKRARIIAATGTSQFEFLDRLMTVHEIDWPAVELFHLDEYVGISPDHPASFNRYIRERIIQRIPIGSFHLLDGSRDPQEVITAVGAELQRTPVDIAFTGLGENGHLAFNDPPADFTSEAPYIVVDLAEVNRRQQFNEGWFGSMEAVPRTAITMTIRQIMKAEEVICIATAKRKAAAVKACFAGKVSPLAPASILCEHPRATIFLDKAASQDLGSSVAATQE
jgi:glucosamine-6-phosphate deaminase